MQSDIIKAAKLVAIRTKPGVSEEDHASVARSRSLEAAGSDRGPRNSRCLRWLGGWSGRPGRASMSFLRNDKRYGNVERCHALGPRSQNIPVRWQPKDM